MNDIVKKILVALGSFLIIGTVGWFIGHASQADQYPTKEEVRERFVPRAEHKLEVDALKAQLDRIEKQGDRQERKIDMILGNMND